MNKTSKNLQYYINRAKQIHGDKYDYSLIKEEEFVNTMQKLPIICQKHGVFYQNFNKHNSGRGCPKCAIERSSKNQKKPLSHFIKRATKTHNGKYDYSLITEEMFTTPRKKYPIICPEHGVFYQSFSNHCNKKGCPQCAKENSKPKKITKEEFVNEAKEVHGDKYDYSMIEEAEFYSSKKVKIKCRCGNIFEQMVSEHLKGRGCAACIEVHNKSKEDIIKSIIDKGFSQLEYLNLDEISTIHSVLKIRCKKHSIEFETTPQLHIDTNSGCPECAKESSANRNRMTYDEFVKKAKEVHGNNYEYPESSRESFNGSHKKVIIVCPKHGEFSQQAKSHLRGIGCWKCQRSHMEETFELKLKQLGIKYEYQKWFDDLRGKSNTPLYFDFYLPERNELIELGGVQHYKCGDYGKFIMSEKQLSEIKERDKRKNEYAKEKGLKMTRIPMDEFDEFLKNFN